MTALTAVALLSSQIAWSEQSDHPDTASATHNHQSEPSGDKVNVAVLIYDGALVLDYGIAAEMFLAADFMRRFHVYTVSRDPDVTLSIVGPMKADFIFENAPQPDVVIVPGGPMWPQAGSDGETQSFLKNAQGEGAILFSICTGAMVLGKAGLLDGRTVTTNHQAAKMLQKIVPTADVRADTNFVDDGSIVTSAGAGTAIEATLHLIERLTDSDVADDLGRRYLNYPHMKE